jgi:hypothetical protein
MAMTDQTNDSASTSILNATKDKAIASSSMSEKPSTSEALLSSEDDKDTQFTDAQPANGTGNETNSIVQSNATIPMQPAGGDHKSSDSNDNAKAAAVHQELSKENVANSRSEDRQTNSIAEGRRPNAEISTADSTKDKRQPVAKTGAKAAAKEPMDTEKPSKKKKLIHGNLYAIITPSFSFQKITPPADDDLEVIGFESPGVMSKERFGLSVDIGYERTLAKKLEWYAGLSFYQQQQRLSYQYYSPDEYDVTSNGAGGFIMTPKVVAKSFNYNMCNAGVTAGLRYMIKSGGLKHKFGAGLQFQQGLLKTSDEEASYNNADASYLNYQLSYRLEMNVRRRLDIFLQPSFTHSILSNESLNEPFKLKPYRAGIGFGMLFHF